MIASSTSASSLTLCATIERATTVAERAAAMGRVTMATSDRLARPSGGNTSNIACSGAVSAQQAVHPRLGVVGLEPRAVLSREERRSLALAHGREGQPQVADRRALDRAVGDVEERSADRRAEGRFGADHRGRERDPLGRRHRGDGRVKAVRADGAVDREARSRTNRFELVLASQISRTRAQVIAARWRQRGVVAPSLRVSAPTSRDAVCAEGVRLSGTCRC